MALHAELNKSSLLEMSSCLIYLSVSNYKTLGHHKVHNIFFVVTS